MKALKGHYAVFEIRYAHTCTDAGLGLLTVHESCSCLPATMHVTVIQREISKRCQRVLKFVKIFTLDYCRSGWQFRHCRLVINLPIVT